MVRVSLLELCKSSIYQLFTVIDLIALVEACNVFHGCALVKDQTAWKDIRLVDVMRYVSWVTSILHVGLPESRTQILWRSSNSCHRSTAAIVWVSEVVLRFSEINDFHLESLRQEEEISWFHISMADADRLQIAQSWDSWHNHLFKLVLLPEWTGTLSLTEQVLQISSTVHVFTDHGYAIGVVHCFVKVIAKEL